MGYALFANRKLYLTALVNDINQKLDAIAMQRQSLLNFSASICDGKVTADELASDASNYINYGEFLQGYEVWAAENGADEVANNIMSDAAAQNSSEAYHEAILNLLNKSLSEKYTEQYNKKIEAQENLLDIQQKKLETKLTAAQKQLESVEQAEGRAIESATPKYAGVA